MQKIKISVIIPCYNQGIYIDEAVDSVLAQSVQDFEIIIINDGSTDVFTKEKLAAYNKPKTRVIHTENRGLSGARNTGFSFSEGEFIQFLDADDIIEPTKFEDQLAVFNGKPEIGICYSDYRIYDINKNEFLKIPDKEFLGDNPLVDFLFRWERGLSIPIHSALFRKSIWERGFPFCEELKAKEDWLMWCSLAVTNRKFYYLNKELAIYRFHQNNMTKKLSEMSYYTFMSVFQIMLLIPENLKREFLKSAIEHINTTMDSNLYPNMVAEISDLKSKFHNLDKTIDYKIGNLLLKPYRYLKTILLGKRYL